MSERDDDKREEVYKSKEDVSPPDFDVKIH